MEDWKDIPGYEGHYKISDLGRVMSLTNSIIRMPVKNNHGYSAITLSKNGVVKTYATHRLVGKLFVPNPFNLPELNHKWGDKMDCRAIALEWCTRSENELHAYKHLSKKHAFCKLVLNLDTGIFYETIKAAAISACISSASLSIRLNNKVFNNTSFILC